MNYWAYYKAQLRRKFVEGLNRVLPEGIKDELALYRIGYVTSSDARLDRTEVPTITVQQIVEAMKKSRQRG